MKLQSLNAASVTDSPSPTRPKETSAQRVAKTDRRVMAGLREGLRKLEVIRKECDVDNEGKTRDNASGLRTDDAWQNSVSSVERLLREAVVDSQARDLALSERGGQTEAIKLGHAVRKALSECVAELDGMKQQNDTLLKTLNSTKAMQKSAKANKAADLAAEESRLQTLYSIRAAEHAALTVRVEQAASTCRGSGSSLKNSVRGKGAAAGTSTTRGVMGGVVRRPRLMDLDLDGGGGAGAGRPMALEMQESEDPESLRLQAQVERQGVELDAALDQIRSQVARLKSQAVAMRDELTTQEAIMDKAEIKLMESNEELKTLNARLKKVQNMIRPQMCVMNTICGILLLSLVGYIFHRVRDTFEL